MLDATVGFDANDPMTANSKGRIPRNVSLGRRRRSLGDVQIGVLTPLFGNGLQDEEVANIVRKAIERLRGIGARVSEVTIPGLDEMMQGTQRHQRRVQVRSERIPGEVSEGARALARATFSVSGCTSSAIDGVLRRSEAVESRETEEYGASLARRDLARQRVVAAMVSQGITALAYPTLTQKAGTHRRAAGRIELSAESERQACRRSACPPASPPTVFRWGWICSAASSPSRPCCGLRSPTSAKCIRGARRQRLRSAQASGLQPRGLAQAWPSHAKAYTGSMQGRHRVFAVVRATIPASAQQGPSAAKNPFEGNDAAIKYGMGLFRADAPTATVWMRAACARPTSRRSGRRAATDEGLWRTISYGVANTEMPAEPAATRARPSRRSGRSWRISKTLSAPASTDPPRGNAENGERIFRANCASCHMVNSRGGRLGPDLSRIGAGRSRDAMVRRIRGAVEDFRARLRAGDDHRRQRAGHQRREEERGRLLGPGHGHARAHPGLRERQDEGSEGRDRLGHAELRRRPLERETISTMSSAICRRSRMGPMRCK